MRGARRAVVEICRAHQRLPRPLRLQWLAPLALALAYLGLLFFELPPGPLCDEGMVLFIEGGCDWGWSNVFFHSKLGLLAALNIGFVIGWRRGVEGFRGFAPHFLVAVALAAANWTDAQCATYYGHPNGSLGQMILEAAAFAFAGVAILVRGPAAGRAALTVALLVWNLVGVGVFYLWLTLTTHWTDAHTALVVASLVLAGTAWLRFGLRPAAAARLATGAS